jgi:hypothetical protein
MVKERPMKGQEKLTQFLQHLEEGRQLQEHWINYGIDCVDSYIENIDRDSLETWGDHEAEQVIESY